MSELFDSFTIDRLLGSFVHVIEQLADDFSGLALRGSLLGPRDALEAAKFSMGIERPEYLSAPLIHDAFDAIAASSPERQCLFFEGEWLSYSEVSQRVSQLAEHLSAMGVKPGVVVGIMMDRSFDLVVSIMAVFKAGGCYLPCDPSYPDDRLEVYLEDAKAALVLAGPHHLPRAKAMVGEDVPVVDVSSIGDAGTAAVRSPGPEDPAYIIFTSGSTGRPKGVVIPHRGVRDLMPYLVDQFKLGTLLRIKSPGSIVLTRWLYIH
jgi:non-ribosomal peptide synthetase component F